jgi:hypothetical protein
MCETTLLDTRGSRQDQGWTTALLTGSSVEVQPLDLNLLGCSTIGHYA